MEMTAIMFLLIVTLLISGGVYVNYWLYQNGAFKEPANREGCEISSLGRLEKRHRSKRNPGRGGPGSRTAERPGAERPLALGIFV